MSEESSDQEELVVGIVRTSDAKFIPSPYAQQLFSDLRPSKKILFQPLKSDIEERYGPTLQIVDIGDYGLALPTGAGPKHVFEERQYVTLVAMFSGIHHLIVSCSHDMDEGFLDCLFQSAHDAGIPHYHLDMSSLSPTSACVLRRHVFDSTRRFEDLGGNIHIYSSDKVGAWTGAQATSLLSSTCNHVKLSKGFNRSSYTHELGTKINNLREAATNLRNRLKMHSGLGDEFGVERHIRLYYLTLSIRRLTSRRNNLALISRLPSELLCLIFLHASHNEDTYRNYPPAMAWVKVSHTCAFWRDVSLSSPELWSRVPVFSVPWTEEMLIRSKSSVLSVLYDDSLTSDYAPLKAALKQLNRIVALSMRIDSSHSLTRFDIEQPAPVLKELYLTLYRDAADVGFIPVQNLFAGAAPRLRRMTLCHGFFDLDSPLFYKLTFLELKNVAFWPHISRISIEGFIAFLERIPALEELVLRDSIPLRVSHGSPTGRTITLHSLRKLLIDETPPPVIYEFLSRVALRDARTSLDLDLGFTISSIRDLRRPLLATISRLSKGKDLPLRSILLSDDNGQGLAIEGWAAVDGPITTHAHPDLRLRIRLSDRSFRGDVLRRVFKSLPFSGLCVVAVARLDLKVSTWVKIIGKLPAVHTVYLVSPPATTLSAVMRSLGFLPSLRILLFRDVFFGRRMKDLTTLAEALVQRAQAFGRTIDHLHFDRCKGMTAAHAAVFRRFVPNVAWTDPGADELESDEFDENVSDD